MKYNKEITEQLRLLTQIQKKQIDMVGELIKNDKTGKAKEYYNKIKGEISKENPNGLVELMGELSKFV